MKLAIDQAGNYISPELALKTGIYFCPRCFKRVVVKKGQKTVAHFAHLAKKDFNNESIEHQIGKQWIEKQLERAGYIVEVEHFLSNGRISDVFVALPNNKNLVIEYQRSKLTSRQLKQRVESYATECVHQWWIQGENSRLPHRRSQSNSQFYRYHNYFGLYHWIFCSRKEQLILQYDLTVDFKKSNKIIGKQLYVSLDKGLPEIQYLKQHCPVKSINEQLSISDQDTHDQAMKNKAYFCRYFRTSKRPIDRLFAEVLYMRGEVIEDVPLKCFKAPFYTPLSSYPLVYWRYYYLTKEPKMKSILRYYKWYDTPFICNKKHLLNRLIK